MNSIIKILVFLSFTLGFQLYAASPQDNPWFEIRKQRVEQLLPSAMKTAQIEAWLVLCRENYNDPLADHIGCENAGAPAAFLFYFDEDEFIAKAYSPIGEATALGEMGLHHEVVAVARGSSSLKQATDFIKQKDFKKVAVNTSSTNAQADGITYSQYLALIEYLGKDWQARIVSSETLVYEWLAIKLPAEVEIMREAAKLTSDWQHMAYATVTPNESTDADVARFIKTKMAEAGVTDAWAPDQNPNINSGKDRGHSHATDKVIQPGDVIQTDFGIRVHDRWVTDIQRFAYVLKPGETKAPADIQRYWECAKKGRAAAFAAMKPGVKGIEVDAAQRKVMAACNSVPVMWSTGHPVGYVAHDTGPNLGGAASTSVRPAARKPLKEGMTFAFDGFFSWKREDGTYKTISVEEMVVIKEGGAEYLIPPQEELILIPSE